MLISWTKQWILPKVICTAGWKVWLILLLFIEKLWSSVTDKCCTVDWEAPRTKIREWQQKSTKRYSNLYSSHINKVTGVVDIKDLWLFDPKSLVTGSRDLCFLSLKPKTKKTKKSHNTYHCLSLQHSLHDNVCTSMSYFTNKSQWVSCLPAYLLHTGQSHLCHINMSIPRSLLQYKGQRRWKHWLLNVIHYERRHNAWTHLCTKIAASMWFPSVLTEKSGMNSIERVQ